MKECCGQEMEWTMTAVRFSFDSEERTADIEAWFCHECGKFEVEV